MADSFTGELRKIEAAIKGVIVCLVVLKCLLIFLNGKNNNNSLAATLEQVKKTIFAGIIALYLPEFVNLLTIGGYFKVVSATDVIPVLLKGVARLVKMLTEAVIFLAATVTAFNLGKEILEYMGAVDEQKGTHIDNAKNILIRGVGIVCGSGFITMIMGYFI